MPSASVAIAASGNPGERRKVRSVAFYESLGYAEIRDFGPGTLRAFVRFD